MKKLSVVLITLLMGAILFAQVTVSGEFTGFYSLGLAEKEQAATNVKPWGYDDILLKKNAPYLNAYVSVNARPTAFLEANLRLRAYNRLGAPYIALSMENASTKDSWSSIEVDRFYGKMDIAGAINQLSPVVVNFVFGKYDLAASNIAGITSYGVDNTVKMLKVGKNINMGLDFSMFLPTTGKVQAQVIAPALVNEFIQKRYDSDDTLASITHGDFIEGKYTPQFLVQAKLSDLYIPTGVVSAEVVYAMNAADSFTGDSVGFGARYTTEIIENVLLLPVGVSFAYYNKNLDSLGNSASSPIDATLLVGGDTPVDFRDTMRIGFGVGAVYNLDNIWEFTLNLGGTYSNIKHYYRDPINVVNAAVEAKAKYKQYFVGAGFIAGTLAKIDWKIKDNAVGVPGDIYNKQLTFEQNYGYEVYAGIDFARNARLVLGYNNNKGLAMNYGIESLSKDGEMKIQQKNASATDKTNYLFETNAFFIKAVLSF